MNKLKLIYNFLQLRKNTHKSVTEIEKEQNTKLRKLLFHAYDHSAYYRNAFLEKGIDREKIAELPISEFPIINKQMMMDHFESVVTVKELNQEDLRHFDATNKEGNFLNEYHLVHSSGSTGEPGFFVYDEEAWEMMLAGILRGALWNLSFFEIIKLLCGGLRIVYIAATNGRYGGAMAVNDGIQGIHAKQLFLDINTPLKEWKNQLDQFNPNLIIGYPSAIKILTDLVETEQIDLSIKRVITCGEPLSYSMRAYFEKLFRSKVINIYGASESLALGVEADSDSGMILFDDMNLIEVVDGKMLVTCLYNTVQPLIRYELKDQLKLVKPLGTETAPFTIVKNLVGRNEDVLWFTDSEGHREFLHPLSIEGFNHEDLIDYQFKQLSDCSFEMIAEARSKESYLAIQNKISNEIKGILNEKRLNYVSFAIRFVPMIMPSLKTGKKQLVV